MIVKVTAAMFTLIYAKCKNN